MSKGISGLFHGTLGTTYINGSSRGESYEDRRIEVSERIQEMLSKLKKKGDVIKAKKGSFSMKDVGIMSKEAGVEFACVTIEDKSYLIRGDEGHTHISDYLVRKMKKYGGTFDFHSHPYDNDCIPSFDDTNFFAGLKRKTGQQSSHIVTPNGRVTTYNEYGVVEVGTVSHIVDDDMKALYTKLFGG